MYKYAKFDSNIPCYSKAVNGGSSQISKIFMVCVGREVCTICQLFKPYKILLAFMTILFGCGDGTMPCIFSWHELW